MNRFAGKFALVTGAASGIGAATARRIAAEGGQVACVDVNTEGLEATLSAISELDTGGAIALPCDVTDEGAVGSTVAAALEQFGRLDALCNVAGVLHADHSHELSLETWNRILSINLTGSFLMSREAIPALLESQGYIVNTSSSAALAGHPWMAAYAASKGGILSMTRSMALEYCTQGLNVNAVIPGAIITPLHGQWRLPKGADGNLIKRIIPPVPYAQPDVVADVIAFLASDDARYVNGSDLRVDGGMLS